MSRKIYSSTEDGGGVPGKDVGTALVIMTEAGVITEAYPLFTDKFLPAGEMILEITNGKGINGSINGCRIRNSSATGAAGKEKDIGKNRIPGVCRDCLPEISREMSGLASLNKAPSKVDKDIIVRKKEGRKDMIEDRAA
jgi:hypothetical protein